MEVHKNLNRDNLDLFIWRKITGSPFSECAPATKQALAHKYMDLLKSLPEGCWVTGYQPSSHSVVDKDSVSQAPSLKIKEKMIKLEMSVDKKGPHTKPDKLTGGLHDGPSTLRDLTKVTT